ncbi:MAG: hypothetical protein LBL28_07080, partial [Treponema sp.]|nr:hypothetical protein [Treponema sp.]
ILKVAQKLVHFPAADLVSRQQTLIIRANSQNFRKLGSRRKIRPLPLGKAPQGKEFFRNRPVLGRNR